MNKYQSNGFRSVKAESMNEAAQVFATREAKKRFGRTTYCRTLNKHSWSQDNTLGEYESFIGYSTGRNETTGTNFRFTVRLVES